MEVQLITAPGDGISPALLLTVGHRLKGQYLFNVPEGFSRLVLEHKIRPTLNLRAVLTNNASNLLGAGGLIMRLRGEGHGQVHFLGPPGIQYPITSLRSFIHWKHPLVLISEIDSSEPAEIYNDEHISIAAIWSQTLNKHASLWKPPEWLNTKDGVDQNKTAATASGRDTNKDDDADTDSTSSSDKGESSSSEETSDSSENESYTTTENDKEEQLPPADETMATKQRPPPKTNYGLLAEISKVDENKDAALEQLISVPKRPKLLHNNSSQQGAPLAVERQFRVLDSQFSGVSIAMEAKLIDPTSGGKQRKQHTGYLNGNNLENQSRERLVAYVCYIKSTGGFLLVTCLADSTDPELLQNHPVMQFLHKKSSEFLAVVHLLGSGVSSAASFKKFSSLIPESIPQCIVPGPDSSFDALGLLASARTTIKLNTVSSRIFPVPAVLRQKQTNTSIAREPLDKSSKGNIKVVDSLLHIKWSVIQGQTTDSDAGNTLLKSKFRMTATSNYAESNDGGDQLGSLWTRMIDVDEIQQEVKQKVENLDNILQGFDKTVLHAPFPEMQQNNSHRQQHHVASNQSAAQALKAKLSNKSINATSANAATIGTEKQQQQQKLKAVVQSTPAATNKNSSTLPELIFLGTGSAEPSKYRGASAIALIFPTGQSMLMDCGDGCMGQLIRLFGFDGAHIFISQLSCIWISHRHADHMAGVPSILAARPNSCPPLLVIGPFSLNYWLSELSISMKLRYVFEPCLSFSGGNYVGWGANVFRDLSLQSFRTVPVIHCSDAHALILHHSSGWSIAYSGDTQPCDAFIQAAQNVSVLIHEATFEPSLHAQAVKKRHSTTKEAMDVARRMNASNVVLTHFSQRYPKFPEGLLDKKETNNTTEKGGDDEDTEEFNKEWPIVAFDGMCVPLSMMDEVKKLMHVVEKVCAAGSGGGQFVA